MHARKRPNGRRMHDHFNHPRDENIQVDTFHDGLKAWKDLYRHCVCKGSYLKYAFSIYIAKLWQSNGAIPSRSWRYIICIIAVGCVPTMHGFLMMTSRQSRSPIGGEGNSQTTHGSIVVEYRNWPPIRSALEWFVLPLPAQHEWSRPSRSRLRYTTINQATIVTMSRHAETP